MSHGFTRTRLIDGLVRDPNATSPASFVSNLTADSSVNRTGTTLTANSTVNTKATTYTTLIASTSADAYGFWLVVYDVALSANNTNQLLDVAVGAASSEVDIVQNISVGQAPTSANGVLGKTFYFPGVFIASGSRISARTQAAISSDTCVVGIFLDLRAQWHIANSSYVTYGADTTNSQGTSVPTAVDGYGAWTTIGGTTSRDHNLIVVAHDGLGDTTMTGMTILIEIGYGSPQTSIAVFQAMHATTEVVSGVFPPCASFAVPSGSQLYARIAGAGTESRGITIYGN